MKFGLYVMANIPIATAYFMKPHEPNQSQSYITTNGQSASLSWFQAPIWHPLSIFSLISLIIFRKLRVFYVGRPLRRGVKQPVREAYHSPPFSAKVKKRCVNTSTTPYVFKA
jgi:hypothetical protein